MCWIRQGLHSRTPCFWCSCVHCQEHIIVITDSSLLVPNASVAQNCCATFNTSDAVVPRCSWVVPGVPSDTGVPLSRVVCRVMIIATSSMTCFTFLFVINNRRGQRCLNYLQQFLINFQTVSRGNTFDVDFRPTAIHRQIKLLRCSTGWTLHCWLQMLPLRGSVVPAKFWSSSGIE